MQARQRPRCLNCARRSLHAFTAQYHHHYTSPPKPSPVPAWAAAKFSLISWSTTKQPYTAPAACCSLSLQRMQHQPCCLSRCCSTSSRVIERPPGVRPYRSRGCRFPTRLRRDACSTSSMPPALTLSTILLSKSLDRRCTWTSLKLAALHRDDGLHAPPRGRHNRKYRHETRPLPQGQHPPPPRPRWSCPVNRLWGSGCKRMQF